MAYARYRVLTIDHTKVGAAGLTNFPVMFSGTYTWLKTVANGGNVRSASGYDIAFFSDAALTVPLKFERAIWNGTTGQVEFWIKEPYLSPSVDTNIYCAYDDASITTDQQDAANVWDTNYKGVWHLGDGSTLSATDSTANANNGTATNVAAASGKLNGAGSFNGSSSSIDVGGGASLGLTSDFTMSVWVKVNNLSTWRALIGKQATSGNPKPFDWYVQGASAYDPPAGRVTLYLGNGTGGQFHSSTTPIVAGTWALVGVKKVGTAITHYLNGAIDGTGTISYSLASGTEHAVIGSRTNLDIRMDGYLDEMRISNVGRSDDWFLTEYNNQNSPSTFYSVGSEVSGGTEVSQAEAGAGSQAQSIAASVTTAEAGAGSDAQTLAATAAASEAGAGVDTASLAVSIAASESGAGNSSQTITATASASELSPGSDSQTASVAVAIAETSPGSEAQSLQALVVASESGAGIDAATLVAKPTASESGAGSEAQSLIVNVTAGEVGAGTDSASASATVSSDESGAGSDSVAGNANASISQSGAGTESVVVNASLASAESGAGSEQVSSSEYGSNNAVLSSEHGAGSEGLGASVAATQVETGAGSEQVSASASASATEAGAGLEQQSVVAALAASETGAGITSTTAGASAGASEAGAGTDNSNLQAEATLAEFGAGQDQTTAAAAAAASDSGAGTQYATVTVRVIAAEYGAGVHVVSVQKHFPDQGLVPPYKVRLVVAPRTTVRVVRDDFCYARLIDTGQTFTRIIHD